MKLVVTSNVLITRDAKRKQTLTTTTMAGCWQRELQIQRFSFCFSARALFSGLLSLFLFSSWTAQIYTITQQQQQQQRPATTTTVCYVEYPLHLHGPLLRFTDHAPINKLTDLTAIHIHSDGDQNTALLSKLRSRTRNGPSLPLRLSGLDALRERGHRCKTSYGTGGRPGGSRCAPYSEWFIR